MENTVTKKTAIAPVNSERRNLAAITSFGRSPSNLAAFADLVGEDARAFIGSALMAVRFSPNLVDCDPESIFSSALRAAAVRLSCDPSLGHAYLVPFRDNKTGTKKAQLIIGYKGIYQLALRSRQYELINVSTIYEGQEVIVDYLTGEVRVLGRGRNRSAAVRIGQLAFFRMIDGYSKALYMTKEEIHDHARRYSRGYEKRDGVWQTNAEAMEKKTVLRLLLTRWGYLDPAAARLIESDEAPNEDQPVGSMTAAELAEFGVKVIDADDPYTGAAFSAGLPSNRQFDAAQVSPMGQAPQAPQAGQAGQAGQATQAEGAADSEAPTNETAKPETIGKKEAKMTQGWGIEEENAYLAGFYTRAELKMTIEEARAVKAGDEVPYGEKSIRALAEYLPNLDKAIRSATDEETAFALEVRRSAILTIFAHERDERGLGLKASQFF